MKIDDVVYYLSAYDNVKRRKDSSFPEKCSMNNCFILPNNTYFTGFGGYGVLCKKCATSLAKGNMDYKYRDKNR